LFLIFGKTGNDQKKTVSTERGAGPMTLAPIACFVYNRPDHAFKALTALSGCDLAGESALYIFSDGARSVKDQEDVEKVRAVITSEQWCGEVHVILRDKNLGLSESVISGVSFLMEKFGKAIVLEDDLVVSPFFLKYMNDSLGIYEGEERVKQITGYMFDGVLNSDTDALFLPFTSSWGWATWSRAWRQFDPRMMAYEVLKKDSKLRKRFNLDGAYNFYTMLKNQRTGRVDSWAIRWYLSVFMAEGLTLYPMKTLVGNIGWDGSGIHCGTNNSNEGDRIDPGFAVLTYPADIKVSPLYEIVKYRLRKRSNIIDRARCTFDAIFKTSL
jgi:hypothetical protein